VSVLSASALSGDTTPGTLRKIPIFPSRFRSRTTFGGDVLRRVVIAMRLNEYAHSLSGARSCPVPPQPIPVVPGRWIAAALGVSTVAGIPLLLMVPPVAWNILTSLRNRIRCTTT